MFDHLTDFSFKRNGKQAFGFYLAFFLLGIILCGLAGAAAGIGSQVSNFKEGFEAGARIGPIVAIIYCLIISGLLLYQKKLFKNFGFILLGVLSGFLAVFGGALLGMIIPAVLTTRNSLKG